MSPQQNLSLVLFVASLPYTFPAVPCYSIAIFPKSFHDWTWASCYYIVERLAFHSATDRPQHKMETDVTCTCRPVALVFQCPLHFERFLPATVHTKESLFAQLASPKGENLLTTTGSVRISCDSQVSGEKLVVKLLSPLSLKLFSLAVQVSV